MSLVAEWCNGYVPGWCRPSLGLRCWRSLNPAAWGSYCPDVFAACGCCEEVPRG